jgi:hypothetical protein
MDPIQTNLIAELGFDKLPLDQQEELYGRIGTLLTQGIIIRALEGMTDAEQDALDTFLGEHPDDAEALLGYLKEHVADFDELSADEVARFKASAVELMKGSTTA